MAISDGWIKKGEVRNPHGPARLPAEVRTLRREDQVAVIKMIRRYWLLTDEQAQQRMDDPEATQLEMAVARQIARAVKDGDTKAFEMMLGYMIGKIPEEVSDDLSDEDLRILARAKEIFAEKRKKLTDGSD